MIFRSFDKDHGKKVSLALIHGGLSWVDRAKQRAGISNILPFPAAQSAAAEQRRHALMTGVDDLD